MSRDQVVHRYCCKRCSAHIGDVTSAGLIMGGGRFPMSVTMCCLACGRANRWYPGAAADSHTAEATTNQEQLVAMLIQQSLSQDNERRLLAAKESRPPRRDAYIDAAEEEADNRLYESIVNKERAKKRA